MLKYRVIIEKDEDGILVAKVPDLPGCATEGKTRAEVMKNVKEAIHAYLEALKEHGDPVPSGPSNHDNFLQYVFANVRFECLFGNQVDFDS